MMKLDIFLIFFVFDFIKIIIFLLSYAVIEQLLEQTGTRSQPLAASPHSTEHAKYEF